MSIDTPGTASDLVAPGDPMQPAINRLLEEPGRFGFFQAVRLLYEANGFDGRGTGARPGPLRFTTPASLAFPPSELHSVVQADAGTRVCVNFLGLTGPSGVLPRTYTELLIARKQVQRDQSAQDFLDLFNHRLVALFWLAWAKHRPEVGRQFGFHNSVYRYLEHIIGLGTPALQARLHPKQRGPSSTKPLPGAALTYFSGLIAQRPHGERAIAQVVSAVVGAPVQATGCLGTWQDIAVDARTRLGRDNNRLGSGCVLGTRYWDRQTTLRLTIGPIDRNRFNTLLPRGALLPDIIELTRFLTGLALDLRIRLSLRADQVPPLRLGARNADRPQLGWNTWLRGRTTPAARERLRIPLFRNGRPIMALNLRALIARLNTTVRGAMEGAAGLCMSRGHYEVEVEHVLQKLMDVENSDIRRILRQFEIAPEALERELGKALDGFKTGNQRTPALSAMIPKLFEAAWGWASIEFGEAKIRSGHVLIALLADSELRRLVSVSARSLEKINLETLTKNFHALTEASSEAKDARALGDAGGAIGGDAATPGAATGGGKPSKTPNLDQYCINLTQRARDGKLDPVLGRDSEIRLMIDVLTRRRQNNPILTGEAGVGKTAVVEGLALRISQDDVPPQLKGVELLSLDLGLLQAGASVKGEFENRLKGVIEEVKSSPKPIIMFIDEAHTLIGAGGAAGQNDAANLLKPALARGEMRTIAATTWSEYKKYFEKDPALTRRFQVVKVDEPDDDKAVSMLRGVGQAMAAHHKVRILDEAITEAVKLSSRFIPGRQLPDKAVSVLDTACAKIAIGQNATPARIEDAKRRLDVLGTERAQLEKEQAGGSEHGKRLGEIADETARLTESLAADEARFVQEKELVGKIHAELDKVEALAADDPARADAVATLNALRTELKALQGFEPMILPVVDSSAVAQIIAGWTGIPVGRMVADEIQTVLKLKDSLEERVIGQSHALDAIAQRVRTSRANLEDPDKPKGVFLLVGTSGVGKTETAIALADALYGGERSMITIAMSEYQEAHTVSSLKGSPPGYVGYGEGGVLTEAVRRRPYSVVLLDEIEKAHPDVLELFFQVFDKGRMEDGEGREIDFRNTLIILTSNAGTDLVMQACNESEDVPTVEYLNELLKPELNRVFKPAFLGRTALIPYYPLRDENMRKIVRLKLNKIGKRIKANHGAAFEYDDAVVDAIAARCTEVDSGARNIDNILTGTVLPEVSGHVLERMAEGGAISGIRIGVAEGGGFSYAVT